MQQPHLNRREHDLRKMFVHLLRGLDRQRLRFLHQRIHDVRLIPGLDLFFQEAVNALDRVVGHMLSDDRFAARRHLVDDGYVEIPVQGQSQRARNRRGGHDEHIRMRALLEQLQALHDAEAMLLIDDGQPQLLQLHVLFEQRVRANAYVRQTLGQQLLELLLLARGTGAGQQHHHIAEFLKQVC